MTRFFIRLLGLGAFLGGPLLLCDLWKPELGQKPAFVLAFAPLGLMLFCALTVTEDEPTRFTRLLAWAGLAGAVGLVTMDGYSLWYLLSGHEHPNRTMIFFGVACGLLASGWLVLHTRRFLATRSLAG